MHQKDVFYDNDVEFDIVLNEIRKSILKEQIGFIKV